ncbi:MAG: hypothetical protein JWM80_6655 [Cyanobacteria bacterium RYN_339]|nr:hypothetical protein [Cyanobacteria bacterium RYN_339]
MFPTHHQPRRVEDPRRPKPAPQPGVVERRLAALRWPSARLCEFTVT